MAPSTAGEAPAAATASAFSPAVFDSGNYRQTGAEKAD